MDQLQRLAIKLARLEEKQLAAEQAVKLQAEKNDVHFVLLNGEQRRLADERAHFVGKDSFEEFRKGVDQKNESIAKALDLQQGKERGGSQVWYVVGGVLTLMFIAIAGVAAAVTLFVKG